MIERRQPIRKLVHQCAQQLTDNGVTPFTRGELIRCVQRRRPDCAPEAIDRTIRDLTGNSRPGAVPARGQRVLHGIGWGLFELMGTTRVAPASTETTASENERWSSA